MNAKEVFETVDGQVFTFEELLHRLREFWANNIEHLPAEFGPIDLLLEAQRMHWLGQQEDGKLIVHVKENSEKAA